jgi:hypothetical protein
LSDIIEIEILNWERFQHKNGTRTYEWFKLDPNIIFDPQISQLSTSEFKVFIVLLCLAAQRRSKVVQTSYRDLARFSRVRAEFSRDCASALERFQIVRLISGTTEENRIEKNRRDTRGRGSKTKDDRIVNNIKTKTSEASAKPAPDCSFFIGKFVEAYRTRYGPLAKPDLSPKVLGQIKNFLRSTDIQRACNMIQVYLQMDDRWFVTKAHDFSTFLANTQKITLALDTGSDMGSVDWNYVFGRENDTQQLSIANSEAREELAK